METCTVGAGALVIEDDKVLLVRLNYGKYKGSWILPGGLLEHKEEPYVAALRELKEETNQLGRVVKPHAVRFRNNPKDMYWVYHVERIFEDPIEYCTEELMDVRFWDISEALTNSDVRPMTQHFIKTFIMSSDQVVPLPKAHVDNDTVYFLTGSEDFALDRTLREFY